MTAEQPSLRQRIADALTAWAERNNSTQYASLRRPATVTANAYSRADAVLAVVQPELDLLRAGAVERSALLDEARDALEAAGMNGAHGDDWPAIAPAIRALAAERDQLRAELADARTAWRRLKNGLIANADLLDVPFSNAPTQSPWKRLKPAMRVLDDSLKNATAVSAPTT